MNIDEVKKIIKDEQLGNYCLFCNNESTEEGFVVIKKDVAVWRVYTNNERSTKTGEKIYSEESAALNDFIERLRGDKAMRKYYSNLL